MSLDTIVQILDPVDPHEVFQVCGGFVGVTGEHAVYDGEGTWGAVPESGIRAVRTRPNQGLPACVEVLYRIGAPLRIEGQTGGGIEEMVDPCHAAVNFQSTGDSRRAAVHVDLVTRLGSWLDARSVRWSWKNEYYGTVHGGADKYVRLSEL